MNFELEPGLSDTPDTGYPIPDAGCWIREVLND